MNSPKSLEAVADELLESYRSDSRAQYINHRFLPSRREILDIAELVLELFYPGYYGRQDLTDDNIQEHTNARITELEAKLERQIERCLCYRLELGAREPMSVREGAALVDVPVCAKRGRELAHAFVAMLPTIRRRLVVDAQAALDGDPAAQSLDEVILAYPGFLAITVHRVAHELFRLGVPLMPRILSEWAHTQTGADIHPGATIGDSFFIDHATGVVVGETSSIGARVKLYQGVTLGALSLPRDANGRVVREEKRHPTVDDDVTIYANATVLGGKTVIGQGSIVGGSAFVTKSVPPRHRVALEAPRLRVAQQVDIAEDGFVPDFEI